MLLNHSIAPIDDSTVVRSVFPSEKALLKSLYLSTLEATKKWTMPLPNWGRVRGELEIMYGDRIPE